MELSQEIIRAFANGGMPLEHFPGKAGLTEMWQYDGGCGGPLVQLFVGVNGVGKPGVFGTYDTGRGDGFDLSGCMGNWLADFGMYIPKMRLGQIIF